MSSSSLKQLVFVRHTKHVGLNCITLTCRLVKILTELRKQRERRNKIMNALLGIFKALSYLWIIRIDGHIKSFTIVFMIVSFGFMAEIGRLVTQAHTPLLVYYKISQQQVYSNYILHLKALILNSHCMI